MLSVILEQHIGIMRIRYEFPPQKHFLNQLIHVWEFLRAYYSHGRRAVGGDGREGASVVTFIEVSVEGFIMVVTLVSWRRVNKVSTSCYGGLD